MEENFEHTPRKKCWMKALQYLTHSEQHFVKLNAFNFGSIKVIATIQIYTIQVPQIIYCDNIKYFEKVPAYIHIVFTLKYALFTYICLFLIMALWFLK